MEINKLEENLLQKQQVEQRMWADNILSKFDDILRANYDKSIIEFAEIVVYEIAKVTHAIRGVFYVVNENQIESTGYYACNATSLFKTIFQFGEDLIGQAIKTKDILYFENHEQNLAVNSLPSLLAAKSVIVVPLLFHNQPYGAIELLFITPLAEKYQELLSRLATNVAAMLQSIQNTVKTKQLLAASLLQAEELRQNIEELNSTQELLLQQQAKLAQQSAYQEAILRDAPMMIISTTIDGIITGFNPLAEQLLGYQANELVDKLSPDIFHDSNEIIEYAPILAKELGEEIAIGFDIFTAKSKKGLPNTKEWTYIAKNGNRFPVELSINSIRNREGNIIGYLQISQDITTRKKIETALRESEAFQQRVFNHSPVPMVIMDIATFKYVDCNEACVQIYGFGSKQATLGKTPLDVSAAIQYDGTPSPEKAIGYINQAMQEGYVSFEWLHQRPDGSLWDADVHLLLFTAGENQYFQFSLIDKTERKKAETESKLFATLMDNSNDALQAVKDDGKLIYMNKIGLNRLGLQKEQIKDLWVRDYEKLFEIEGSWETHIAEMKQAKALIIESVHYNQQNKQNFPVEVSIQHVEVEGQGYLVATSRDITERKKQEAEIQAQNEELKASEEELKQNLEELTTTQDQLQLQFIELSAKNKNISDSINYARRIQNALLPRLAEIKAVFPDSFVFYRPKDVISGDFYWFANKFEANIQIIVTSDCTGHGVPGAFMSMLGSSLLSNIVHNRDIYEPNKILDLLHIGIEEMLNQRQEDSTNRDGMDTAICMINRKENYIAFAGANSSINIISNKPLYFIEGGKETQILVIEAKTCLLTALKADKKSIGGRIIKQNNLQHTVQKFKLDQDFHIYMSSDGLIDQIGGKERRKLMSNKYRQLLIENHHKSYEKQKIFFNDFFEDWISHFNYKQLDDVMLLGVKVI